VISISVPLPAKELSPNARVHWRVKAKATKAARENAFAAAIVHGKPMWKAASVLCVFTFKDKRSRDRDNLLSSLKAVFDGLADAGVVANDSALTYKPVEITAPDKANPRVVIYIEETK
jgi:Holliday junction resolvase RusA-like endonuclease